MTPRARMVPLLKHDQHAGDLTVCRQTHTEQHEKSITAVRPAFLRRRWKKSVICFLLIACCS